MKTREEFKDLENKEYFDYFFSCHNSTYKQNWQQTEEWWQETRNIPKFTSYASFRVAKTKYLNGLHKRRWGASNY